MSNTKPLSIALLAISEPLVALALILSFHGQLLDTLYRQTQKMALTSAAGGVTPPAADVFLAA
ncbi:MAG: hypothetical protein AAGT88_00490 [Dethiobacter sp.]